jgi:two-component system LytT family response regulator
MKKVAIIDNDEYGRETLKKLLKQLCPDVEICGEATSVASAYPLICRTKPHGILLDITMQDGTSFDLLDKFQNPNFQIIFTTAKDDYALKAFRYHAVDYLLKPVNPQELVQAIARIKDQPSNNYRSRLNNLLENIHHQQTDRITLSSQEDIVFVSVNKILRLESDGSYTTFWLKHNEKHLVSRPMKDFEYLLFNNNFFKVHQSHIINLKFVKKIIRQDGGFVLMTNGKLIPIARRRKEEFLALMKQ